jgi:hypothetical protein
MNEMKERPILFSAPMVRAILAGQKTVTRREVTKQAALDCLAAGFEPSFLTLPGNADLCPYGKPSDRLWVRETWGVISHNFDQHGNAVAWEPDRPAKAIREMRFGGGYYSGHVIYRADGPAEWAGDDDGGGEPRSAWKSSIHMPRIASRILLEITGVRVERLQDISRSDIRAEGLVCPPELASDDVSPNYRDWYPAAWRELWQSINGPACWEANPWVWVVEFERVLQELPGAEHE